MLVWGSGGETKDLGVLETKHCETCEKGRPFKLFLQYRFAHIWYLFKWVSKKEYLLLCDVCHRGAPLDTKKVESSLAKNPIPLATRYGWTLLVALVFGFLVFVGFESQDRRSRDDALIGAPQANDLYVVNLAKLISNPEADPMYGLLKLRGVEGERAAFTVSNVSYNKVKGVTKDIDSGKVTQNDYFGTDVLRISIAELKAMREAGTIDSIRR